MHKMSIGSPVANTYHGIIRFGIIRDKLKDDQGWTQFHVEWIKDDTYDSAMWWVEELGARSFWQKELYRADELQPIDRHRFIAVADSFRRP
jgi:hypothetical protein